MAAESPAPQRSRKQLVIGGLAFLVVAFVVITALDSSSKSGGSPEPQPATSPAAPPDPGLQPDGQPDPVAGFYSVYPMSDELVEGLLATTTWGKAALKYRRGEYSASLAGFETALGEGEMPAELIQFYLGQAQLASGQAEAAVGSFEAVIAVDGNLAEEGQWYLALAQARLGEEAAAKELLEQLALGDGVKKDQARQLLEHLGQ